jgi:hypothetical protein
MNSWTNSWTDKQTVSQTQRKYFDFIQGQVAKELGISSVWISISVMGFSRLISTWVSSHAADIGPTFTILRKSFITSVFSTFFDEKNGSAQHGLIESSSHPNFIGPILKNTDYSLLQ